MVVVLSGMSGHADVLRELRDKLSATLDAQTISRYIFQHKLLTQSELESIQSRRKEPTAAANLLLDIVIKQSPVVYNCFSDALKETGHEHIYELIVTGNITGTRQERII